MRPVMHKVVVPVEKPEPRAWLALPLLAAIAYLALTIHAAWVETPTVDECAHVPAGLAYWRHGRLDLCSTNPPLLKFWTAAPIALDPSVKAPDVIESPLGWGPWKYGERFMNANRESYLGLIFRARLMVIVLGLATGAIILTWSRQVFGLRAAAVCASLFLLCPNILAHAHLATIDMGCVFSITLAMFTLRWAYKEPTAASMLVAGAALGLALAIKFLAVLILPAVVILVLVNRWMDTERTRPMRIVRALFDMILMTTVAVMVINASMGFRGSFTPLGDFTMRSTFGLSVASHVPHWLPVPLPREYVTGFDAVKKVAEEGELGSYLLGEWSAEGWWHYNLTALGVKMPVVFLALLLVSPLFWRRSGAARIDMVELIVPPIVLLVLFSTFNSANIGVRHTLPALPFAFMLLGPVFKEVGSGWRRWVSVAAIAIALVSSGINIARIHPNYLTFFNTIAGGPEKGSDWLIDSNLDWGQDLYRLPETLKELSPDGPVYLLYFGHVDPRLYGIEYVLPPAGPVEGVIALSVNFVKGYPYVTVAPGPAPGLGGRMVGVKRDAAAWLKDRQPVRKLGSIWIYDTRRESPTKN